MMRIDIPVSKKVLRVKVAAITNQPIDDKISNIINTALDNILISKAREESINHNDVLIALHGTQFTKRVKRIERWSNASFSSAINGDDAGGVFHNTKLVIDKKIILHVSWFLFTNYEREKQRLKSYKKDNDGSFYDAVEYCEAYRCKDYREPKRGGAYATGPENPEIEED